MGPLLQLVIVNDMPEYFRASFNSLQKAVLRAPMVVDTQVCELADVSSVIERSDADWFVFAKGRDEVDPDFFEKLEPFLDQPRVIATQVLRKRADNGTVWDNAPFRERFPTLRREVDLNENPWDMWDSWWGVCVHRSLIDGVGELGAEGEGLLVHALAKTGGHATFTAEAKYLKRYYFETPTEPFEDYTPRLAAMEHWLSQPDVPTWVWQLVICELQTMMERDRQLFFRSRYLEPEQRAEIGQRLLSIAAQIPDEQIEQYALTPLSLHVSKALQAAGESGIVSDYIVRANPREYLPGYRVSYFYYGEVPEEEFFSGSERIEPLQTKIIDHSYYELPFVCERVLWLPKRPRLSAKLNGKKLEVKSFTGYHPRPSSAPISWKGALKRDLTNAMKSAVKTAKSLVPEQALDRVRNARAEGAGTGEMLAAALGKNPKPASGERHWLYLDREMSVGDGAIQLYRYAAPRVPGTHSFALSLDSPQWAELEAEGVNLVATGTRDFDEAVLSADTLLIADIGDYALTDVWSKIKDRNIRTVFLQHGITLRQMWRWMNRTDFTYLVTSLEEEYEEIARDHSSYWLMPGQLLHAQMPRFDDLAGLLGRESRYVLLAPTWQIEVQKRLRAGEDVHPEDTHLGQWLDLALNADWGDLQPVMFVHPVYARWMNRDYFPLPTVTGTEVPEVLAQSAAVLSDKSSLIDDGHMMGIPGIIWNPDNLPDFDRYRDMHVKAGAHIATSREEALALADKVRTGEISREKPIVDGRARERLVNMLLGSEYWRPAEPVALLEPTSQELPTSANEPAQLPVPPNQLSITASAELPTPIRASLISPVYGVGEFLPEFFDSLDAQTLPHDQFEVILVCDGRVDSSPEQCHEWAAKTDIPVRVIEIENSGQGAARNVGLTEARGEWVGFPDPDDVLSANYLAELLGAADRYAAYEPSTVTAHITLFGMKKPRRHALEFRFARGERVVDPREEPAAVQLSASDSLFKRSVVDAGNAKFAEDREAATFEDAMFVGDVREVNPVSVLVPGANYFYRQRETSTVGSSWANPKRFTPQMLRRYLPYLKAHPHPWAVQAVLYDVAWYFVAASEGSIPRNLTDKKFMSAFRQVLRQMSTDDIVACPWAHFRGGHRAVALMMMDVRKIEVVRGGTLVRDDAGVRLIGGRATHRRASRKGPKWMKVTPARFNGQFVGWNVVRGGKLWKRSEVVRVPINVPQPHLEA
ncbi:glycosyltransferase involved in cell wall biosynthesis [Arcanobacterium wilhelmae]|uniref:Glycosyltransferase involved in cell wall biosynthesis n=1 Tax=Arcanobacterium wilhelmae TaxID=1803177 RepID=A0ABT9NDG5_9ACTO|nr:glycosyltransferase family 2 protein [Arcanobacterium wilhelmae]MDP9801231.1 glycosyltransferase involved in cell wall biosynthesis [Arcanobacterium wilhelmae]